MRISYITPLRVVEIFILRDRKKWIVSRSPISVSDDKWHHVAVTVDGNLDETVFIDGCRQVYTLHESKNVPQLTPKRTYVGCNENHKMCAYVALDELRIWNEKKDDHFIWYLWKAN